ncbi:MAG: alpha/beta hydrolase [Bryobacteraceae bacterium]
MTRLLLAAAVALSLAGADPPGVDVLRDISYTVGSPEDAPKHQLDLYRPTHARNAPVLLFIHGGAWRAGDRRQYIALGNRFAREGIVTAVMSYRLAPKNPHPAQIQDVAAAFAWVARNIGKHGGDPKRIFVAGHSAGGHLAALLTLDQRYLRTYGLSSRDIRGTITLSGVYEVRGEESVFGKDPRARKQASPLSYVKAGAPPFLIVYCERDFPTLPAQARWFHRALRDAGVPAELVFIPGQGHISEIVHLGSDGDPTAQAILRFMKR